MAELEQLEALRRQNKDLLEKLKKQAEKLHELKLSRPDEEVGRQSSVCEAFNGSNVSGQCLAPLTERNGEKVTAAGRAAESVKTQGEQFEDCESPKHRKHNQSSVLSPYSKLLQDTGNSRWHGHRDTTRLMLPKSVPLTQYKMEVDSATSLFPGLENDSTYERRRIRPLLGYDWIAGLVDAESSLTERPEHFFSDLQNFRRVNGEECIQSSISGPPLADLASSTLDDKEPQESPDTHQCTFCYRINSRLFATPLDPQTACPVCKMPKSEHLHTKTEPAIIRVSIPRSALLPSYKYKAHRRCSFDPSDSLGLPSHCLSGWSDPTLSSGYQMSSLDLRGSMTAANNKQDSSLFKESRHRRSDLLLSVSRLPRYHFQHSDTKMPENHCSPYAPS
ncbi:migration and invasion-inhibitory protein [Misgurnus anguillicaudatus]|uniref:migration and invasion-inhibitory protein n=1 Tax=Misgurnus anguillicaudatus TaxID=75329 RepID=UPI003CCF5586